MLQVARTAAHLLCRGRVADMGMGSGAGSHALAALHPEMRVVGVDVDGRHARVRGGRMLAAVMHHFAESIESIRVRGVMFSDESASALEAAMGRSGAGLVARDPSRATRPAWL